MRLWIAAILALQFFCSLGIGALDRPALERHQAVHAAAEPVMAAEQPGADMLSVLDREHDLLDEIPDLPDGLDPWPLGLAGRADWGRTPPHRNRHSPSPSLEGIQRPPQA
jgi:hypothetical protein